MNELPAPDRARASALLREGADLFRSGRPADAAVAFHAALELDETNAAAWTNLAIALDASGNRDAAKSCFVRAIAIDDSNADVWFLLGCLRENENDLAGAELDLRKALALDPESAAAWKRLGALLQRRANASDAITALQRSLALSTDAATSASLGKLLYEQGRMNEARDAYATAVAREKTNAHFSRMLRNAELTCDLMAGTSAENALAKIDPKASLSEQERIASFEMTGATLTRFGYHAAALRLARLRAELWPDSPEAHYLLASLLGEDLVRSPDAYIVASFDAFAEGFDAQLVDALGYDVPEQLRAMLGDILDHDRRYETLDIGCGTGLCGPLLRPHARSLIGLDLSPKMLDRARARNVYDALVCEEVTAFLDRKDDAYDLIVAADVLIYFGDLRPLFAAAAKAMRAGGIFAFSIERGDASDYRLGPSGRFAHSTDYVERVARASFDTLVVRDTTLRREGVDRVRGCTFALRSK